MRKFCITGISGVGKSSVIEELNKKGIKAFDVDAVDGLCQWRDESGKIVDYYPGIGKEWLDKNNYFCDVEKLEKIINKSDGEVIVVSGLATNQDEFLKLFDKIFLLRCDKEIFLHRLSNRNTNDFARDKSEQEHILGYYKEFEADMIKRGAISIETNIPLKAVVYRVISEIEKI